MSLPSTSATITDCERFVAAVQNAQGRVPDVLANYPLRVPPC